VHWKPVLPGLAKLGCAVAWDYRGHGSSDAPQDPSVYELERVLADLRAVHLAMGAEPAWLVGLSFGGLLSLSYALRWPGDVRGLVLINSGPGFKKAESRERWRSLWERAAAKLEDVGIEAYLQGPRAIEEILGTAPDSPAAREARAAIAGSDARALAHFARGVAAPQPDLTGQLDQISQPVLVLCGQQDPAFHRAGELFEARLPRVQRRMIPAAGHPLPLDAPEALLREIHAFHADPP
jgi:pimeloyl-ACP methyl ester carboxylesterase